MPFHLVMNNIRNLEGLYTIVYSRSINSAMHIILDALALAFIALCLKLITWLKGNE